MNFIMYLLMFSASGIRNWTEESAILSPRYYHYYYDNCGTTVASHHMVGSLVDLFVFEPRWRGHRFGAGGTQMYQ